MRGNVTQDVQRRRRMNGSYAEARIAAMFPNAKVSPNLQAAPDAPMTSLFRQPPFLLFRGFVDEPARWKKVEGSRNLSIPFAVHSFHFFSSPHSGG